ncbi:MAG: hypothetical protein K2X47_13995 [Bdellovibrionales bacterium]|nr:hypothetical protein [Bdellovibrionales bacterium]
MMDWNQLLQDFENKIRLGQGARVKKAIQDIGVGRVPKAHYGALSNISTRVGLPGFALRLLGKEIRKSDIENSSNLSLFEKAEYACALSAIGAYSEAHRILKNLDGDQHPQIHLYTAFALFNQWRYPEAIPSLQQFLKIVDTPYLHRVGRVNLAAALVFCQNYKAALLILTELQHQLLADQQKFLLGNVMELQAQCYLGLSDFGECDRVLNEATTLLDQTGSYFGLFAKKWHAVLALKQHKPEGLKKIIEVRTLAQDMEHFETLRECDFFEGILTSNNDLIQKVYYGSPFSFYREKIVSAVGHNPFLSPTYEWKHHVELGGSQYPSVIDASRPLAGDTEDSALHNLQKLFFSDFYASLRVGTVFSKIFPKEHYNISSSPNRIYQLIHRWNKLAERLDLPTRIFSDGVGFRIRVLSPCTIVVSRTWELGDKSETQVRRLREYFGSKPFRSWEAQNFLERSQSQISVLLSKAQELGLQKKGSGRSTVYQFVA